MTITYEKQGHIGIFTIDNGKVNALTFAMHEQLYSHLNQFLNDSTIKVGILKGSEGKCFSAGDDLNEGDAYPEGEDISERIFSLPRNKPIIGAINSSNSNRLRDIGAEMSVPSYLIEDAGSINLAWLEDVETVGITAGASAPEDLVQEVVSYLKTLTEVELETLPGIVENVEFKLPSELEKS